MNPELPKISDLDLPPDLPPDVAEDLRDAIEALITGVRDPEKMRQAAERMDRMQKELGDRIGETNIAVELIREVRGEA